MNDYIQAWRKEGFVFSTPSNEAVKLYDAALTQVYDFLSFDPCLTTSQGEDDSLYQSGRGDRRSF
jgi:hypothetical protein